MRVRALDVLAAHVGGHPLQFSACTLAARTESGGERAWEASGWVGGHVPELSLRDGVSSVVPVALETDEGTCAGLAVVSVAAHDPRAGSRLRLVGVGGLEPWPG